MTSSNLTSESRVASASTTQMTSVTDAVQATQGDGQTTQSDIQSQNTEVAASASSTSESDSSAPTPLATTSKPLYAPYPSQWFHNNPYQNPKIFGEEWGQGHGNIPSPYDVTAVHRGTQKDNYYDRAIHMMFRYSFFVMFGLLVAFVLGMRLLVWVRRGSSPYNDVSWTSRLLPKWLWTGEEKTGKAKKAEEEKRAKKKAKMDKAREQYERQLEKEYKQMMKC